MAKAEKAPATRKAYATDFRLFKVYCDAKGVSALPVAPETVASYIAAEAQTAKPSTIGRRVAAIRYAHKLAGFDTPTDAEGVKATMRGICRTFGSAKNKKAPAVVAKMLSMVATVPDRRSGLRDRALLLLGFAGAFRRSELVALDVADIEETQTGLLITIRRSKTDQEALGRTIAITRGDVACPVKALREWLDAAGIVSGSLFRPINKSGTVAASRLTCRSVANIVKEYAGRAGFDGAIFSAHSLRSGVSDFCSSQGCVDLQDDGPVRAQVDRYPARLRSRCRTIQGSRGSRIALSINDRGASTRRHPRRSRGQCSRSDVTLDAGHRDRADETSARVNCAWVDHKLVPLDRKEKVDG